MGKTVLMERWDHTAFICTMISKALGGSQIPNPYRPRKEHDITILKVLLNE